VPSSVATPKTFRVSFTVGNQPHEGVSLLVVRAIRRRLSEFSAPSTFTSRLES
jgi:hypothetical protein